MKLQICYAKKCERLLRPVSDAIFDVYGLRTYANKALDLPGTAYNSERKQYDAPALLDYLSRVKNADIALWLVDREVYSNGKDRMFGYSLDHYGAVLSTSGLNFAELIQKEAAHEVGHVVGLKHCMGRCLMQYSRTAEEAKEKPMELCKKCQGSVKIPDLINIH